MTPPRWRTPLAPALAAAVCATLALDAATAASWSLGSNLQLRGETNDNPALVADASASSRQISLRGAMSAAREMENSAARLDADLQAPMLAQDGGRLVQGRVALGLGWTGPLDSYGASFDLTRDDNLGARRTAGDVLIGRSRRTSASVGANWSHALSERFNAQADYTLSSSRYGGAGAQGRDYRNRSLGGSIGYRWDELLRLNLQAGRSWYRLDSGDEDTVSDNLRLGASRALSETSSVSAGVGRYRTRRSAALNGFVCPLDEALCSAGLVARVPVRLERDSTSGGTQYDASYELATSERGSLRLTLSRQLSPSALGVVQADSLNAGFSWAWSPTLRGSTMLSQSSTRTPAAPAAAQPRLRTLDLSVSWTAQENLSLSAGALLRQFQEPTTHLRARSNAFSITLQYQAPTMRSSP